MRPRLTVLLLGLTIVLLSSMPASMQRPHASPMPASTQRLQASASDSQATSDRSASAERRIMRTGPEQKRPLPAAAPRTGSWPTFRGTEASGVADGQRLPDRWDGATGRNILWRTPIPGLAHSSPVVWGQLVFVTTAVSSDPKATFKPGLYGDGSV